MSTEISLLVEKKLNSLFFALVGNKQMKTLEKRYCALNWRCGGECKQCGKRLLLSNITNEQTQLKKVHLLNTRLNPRRYIAADFCSFSSQIKYFICANQNPHKYYLLWYNCIVYNSLEFYMFSSCSMRMIFLVSSIRCLLTWVEHATAIQVM